MKTNAYKRLLSPFCTAPLLTHTPHPPPHSPPLLIPMQALRENPGHSLLLVPEEFLSAMLEEVGSMEDEGKPKKGGKKSSAKPAAKKAAAKPAKKAVKATKKPAAKKVLKKERGGTVPLPHCP